MAVIRKAAVAIAAPALLVALSGTAVAEEQISPADFNNCPSNYGCFYTGANGTGAKCQWTSNNRQHADQCSWAAERNVLSIANRKSSYLCFYRFPDYSKDGPWGWVVPNGQGNTSGTYKVLSHRWVASPASC